MKRVLFVDDEPRILEGLQRMLRPQRAAWQMRFANSGAEALSALAAAPADIVVTDMKMPSIDGAELLESVQARFPATVRIILSGYFDGQSALRASTAAHQFLAKPCDSARLRSAVEGWSGAGSLTMTPELGSQVLAIGQLPVLASIRTRIIEVLSGPNASLDAVGALAALDIGFSAKVLQLAHSAFFGLPSEIDGVPAAIRQLGLDAVRHLINKAASIDGAAPAAGAQFTFYDLQAHSLLAARIAAHLPVAPSDRSYLATAALLHDVGTLVLGSAIATAAPASHAEVGAFLLALWGFPDAIVEAVLHHHSAEAQSSRPLSIPAAVRIADALACSHSPSCRYARADAAGLCLLPDGLSLWGRDWSHWNEIAARETQLLKEAPHV